MLVVMIFGTQPVKTDLIFDTLDRCPSTGAVPGGNCQHLGSRDG
jgi:hypothetical protein